MDLAYIEVPILEAVNYSPKESFRFLNKQGTCGQGILDIAICENKDLIGFLSKDRLLKIMDYSAEDKEVNSTILMR